MDRPKIRLDKKLVDYARKLAKEITDQIQQVIDQHSTVSVERAVLRLFGIDGVTDDQIPLVNVVVDKIKEWEMLQDGVTRPIVNAMIVLDKSAQEIAEAIVDGLDLRSLPHVPDEKIDLKMRELSSRSLEKIEKTSQYRENLLKELGDPPQPYKYLIVATGNIYEDVIQARAAVKQGADIIAVIRSTAQSLLDYVPYGATTEGYGGTYATQENFRIMRQALDDIAKKVGRYIRQVNYASGLCMPEIAALAALEGLDILLNDAMYGILFRDINMIRTFTDQYISRLLCAFSGITINTGEDNYLTTADAIEKAHTVTASQLINEQFALKAGMKPRLMGLGHAFEINPEIEDGLLYEIAHAMLARELFANYPIKYMPPTKFMTGNIFKGYAMETLFNLVSVMTGQSIQLLGILTEAIHTPYLHDRYLALINANYVFNNARHLGREVIFKKDGFVEKRANEVLREAVNLLEHTRDVGLLRAIEEGQFADIPRARDGGKGLDGVFKKSENYVNPIQDELERRLGVRR
ncbi:lysine 5,6-aminomutase subunit alpha [Thermotoga profunda]|uniref:lysine 5,6-aminomutase subunit alpha n=1 Tax=Thermotoga profunda TaxID=1508420 RepID=UPI000596C46D|nr:lysine 5,6-aminomutase subunit alpha [Thermotoga profunda]